MYKELEALKNIENFNNKRFFNITYDNGDQVHYEYLTIKDLFPKEFDIIETALKNQKRKLDLISEVLVDISKGNYADLNDAINEIREVLESE